MTSRPVSPSSSPSDAMMKSASAYGTRSGRPWPQPVPNSPPLASPYRPRTSWGQGRPDLVPYAEADFIIASLGEELGLTGLLVILLCYLVLAERGLRTAIGVRDGFGKLLAGGLAFTLALQCFIVVGGITRIIPLTGLTTPFLACGGSSLLASWIVVALLLRISDDARRPAGVAMAGPPPRPPATTAPIPVRTSGATVGSAAESDDQPTE